MPENAQFKTSQQLFNPNQMNQDEYHQPWNQHSGGASLASIWNIARRDVPIPVNSPTELLSENHATFILKYGKTDNLFEYIMSEHLRLSGLYWCITALDIMGKKGESDMELIFQVINEAKNDDGGYGAAKGHASHILHTLCAVQVLVTLDRMDLIDVESLVKFVKSLQQEDGSFHGTLEVCSYHIFITNDFGFTFITPR
uniref:Geranylgeranyl transferase type II subunit beta n=1 Tax=Panagrolaimus davidi TaxID=227884 RepID=A0A914QYQ0_9BILA